jgi:hypothetical protein
MLNDISPGQFRKIYIACGYTDLRYGVDDLIVYPQIHKVHPKRVF